MHVALLENHVNLHTLTVEDLKLEASLARFFGPKFWAPGITFFEVAAARVSAQKALRIINFESSSF